MHVIFLFRVLMCLFVATIALSSQLEAAETPKPGSPERKAICRALRLQVEKEIGIPVIFRISHLKVQDDWAFFMGRPRTKNDKPIDYSKTPLAEDAEFADESLVAVLRKNDGRWTVIQHAIFTTDVWWHGLHKQLGAPVEIFDYKP